MASLQVPAHDFWPSCGYELLTSNDAGYLVVSDDFLRSMLMRSEIAPVAASCEAEIALHEKLLADPRRAVPSADLSAVLDSDAAENYAVWLRFRERLLAFPTLEASYTALFLGEGVDVAPVFVQQLTQILLRHVLRETTDTPASAMQARVVALDALCRVLERWIAHFLSVEVRIQTDREIVGQHWVWHVGLDAQTSSLLNDLYTGKEVDEDRMRRLMCLFRLEFVHPADMLTEVAGRPVYLAMAMNETKQPKLKSQNLFLNLPLARRSSCLKLPMPCLNQAKLTSNPNSAQPHKKKSTAWFPTSSPH